MNTGKNAHALFISIPPFYKYPKAAFLSLFICNQSGLGYCFPHQVNVKTNDSSQYYFDCIKSTTMLKLFFYALNILLAGICMLVFDDDPTQVSILEWVLYSVILISTWSLVKIALELQKKSD